MGVLLTILRKNGGRPPCHGGILYSSSGAFKIWIWTTTGYDSRSGKYLRGSPNKILFFLIVCLFYCNNLSTICTMNFQCLEPYKRPEKLMYSPQSDAIQTYRTRRTRARVSFLGPTSWNVTQKVIKRSTSNLIQIFLNPLAFTST